MTLRRAGARWRLLVHEKDGSKSHHVLPKPLTYPRSFTKAMREKSEEIRAKYSTETILPDTIFDELVVDHWCHIEQMDTYDWWVNVGGVTVNVTVDRDGRPRRVNVYGPNDYDAPREGCEYRCTWSGS